VTEKSRCVTSTKGKAAARGGAMEDRTGPLGPIHHPTAPPPAMATHHQALSLMVQHQDFDTSFDINLCATNPDVRLTPWLSQAGALGGALPPHGRGARALRPNPRPCIPPAGAIGARVT
jgi:hypothetical protein